MFLLICLLIFMLERTESATGLCILQGNETTTKKTEGLALGRSSRFLWGWQSSYYFWCYFEVTVNYALMFSGEDNILFILGVLWRFYFQV